MQTPAETAAIRSIFDAATKLSNDYATVGGASNRRDQLAAFAKSTIASLAALTAAYGDDTDPAYVALEAESLVQAIEVAFADQIEAEEAAEPAIDYRQYSTLRVVNGSVA